jgi:DNA-binding NtrC family response regulator
MPGFKVLVVDDEPTYRTSISRVLTNESYQVTAAASAEEAVNLISLSRYDLVITDLKMPGMSGIDLLSKMEEISPASAAIIMTAHATIDTAIEATKMGAFHYLIKPFNIDEVIQLAKKAIDHKKLKEENTYLKKQLQRTNNISNIIGKSEEMQKVFRLIEKVSDTDSTVLITGESGTGKELVAKAIHYLSQRSKKLMVPVNCAAIPSELLESELFGHVKGSFTGAISARKGKFEIADEGTIFLDEVAELPMNIQAKFLRILQERRFESVGSNKTIDVNVRVIAASNSSLERLVNEGKFREDLFYRLNVIPIVIPSLRERTSDIPLLVNHFLSKFNKKKNRGVIEVHENVMHALIDYPWPGNVRELENLIERLVTLNEGVIELEDLPAKYIEPSNQKVSVDSLNFVSSPSMNLPDDGIDLNRIVKGLEEDLIMKALDRTNWNKNRAAKLLNLNRTTLVEKLRKKGLIKSRSV